MSRDLFASNRFINFIRPRLRWRVKVEIQIRMPILYRFSVMKRPIVKIYAPITSVPQLSLINRRLQYSF